MPKDGVVTGSGATTQYEYLTEEQIKEIETQCQVSGCNAKEELEQANNEQKTNLEEAAKINKLQFTNPEQAKIEKLKSKHLTMDQILKLQKDGKINSKEAFALVANGIKTGKISAWKAFWKGRKAIQEFVKNNPEAQKVIADFMQHPTDWGAQYRLLSLADKYIGGPFHAGKELADVAVVEPWNAFKKEFKEHPIETIQNIKTGLLIVVVSIAVPPVGIVLVTGGILVTGTSMGIDYYQGGWDKAKHHIFSQKTIDMDKSGDWWGARTRQVAEMGGFILSNIPDSPTRTLETVTILGGLLIVKKEITAAEDARAAFSILKQTGRVSKETFKVGQELFKVGLSKGTNETKLLSDYLFNNNNLAYLGTISKDVNNAEKIGGLEARKLVLKKEFDELMQMVGSRSNSNVPQGRYFVKQTSLPRTVESSVTKGSLVDPAYGSKAKYTPSQLRAHENANQYTFSSAHPFEHVNKTDTELRNRAIAESKRETSTYLNDEKLTQAVNGALEDSLRQKMIKDWLKNPSSDKLVVNYRDPNGKALGRIFNLNDFQAGKKAYTNSDKALIVLKKRPDNSGYYILTSYVVSKF